MPHDPALLAEVRAWLTKAAKDLAAAEYELRADPPFVEDIAFHSQQAAEKSLKAFLAWHQLPFRKTHNLVELGEACNQLDQSLEALLRRAAPLRGPRSRGRGVTALAPGRSTCRTAANGLG